MLALHRHLDYEPPPPEGAAHFSWDANVQSLLEQVVQAYNDKNLSTADDVAINPYLIPRVGISGSSAWIEVSLPDGSTVREGLNCETIASRLIGLLQDNGGLAPSWQVQTEQVKWQNAQEHVQQLTAQHDALLTTTEVQTEDGTQTVQNVLPGKVARYAELCAQLEQAEHRLSQLPSEFRVGIGGQAVAGDEAFAIQGNAVESADFKSQSFGALVVHVTQHAGVQASVQDLNSTLVKTREILRDVDQAFGRKAKCEAANDKFFRCVA